MMKILITGGSGLVGTALSKTLERRGHDIAILTRNINNKVEYKQYLWDPLRAEIDVLAIKNLDCIIHLAGARIGQKRWTKKYKEELLSSRVDSAQFLLQKIKELNVPLKYFISSSAIGWYGVKTTDEIYTEEAKASNHFLGQLCERWEQVADAFELLGCQVSKVRTGIVFSEYGGALAKLSKPILWGQGAALGSGRQYMAWIHVDDLCEIYAQLVEGLIPPGVYNGVAPDHITNDNLTKLLARALDRHLWLPNIPTWIINMLFGEMSSIMLNGSRVSSKKLIEHGFDFKYPTITEALARIII